MSYVLAVTVKALEGNEDEVAATMCELAEETRKEPGCELYIPVQSTENPRSFLVYEQYVDSAALDAHSASDHFQRLAAGKLHGLLESRERATYETL
jgi:autoinducer 2-degrading protein